MALQNAFSYLESQDLGQWPAADVLAFLQWADGFRYPRLPVIPTPEITYRRWVQSVDLGEDTVAATEAEAVRAHKDFLSKRRRQWEWRRAKLAPVVFARANHTCQICGHAPEDLCVDHIVPISLGGTDDLDNLQAACWDCNSRKGWRR